MNKKVLCGIMALGVITALTGCGKENVDVSAKADVLFNQKKAVLYFM